LLVATVFGMWGVAVSEHPSLRIMPTPELHGEDHRDGGGVPSGHDASQALDFAELEDSDEDAAHHALAPVVLGPDAAAEHAHCHGRLSQPHAHEPPTPPPRA
jgi:hypothetical protein